MQPAPAQREQLGAREWSGDHEETVQVSHPQRVRPQDQGTAALPSGFITGSSSRSSELVSAGYMSLEFDRSFVKREQYTIQRHEI